MGAPTVLTRIKGQRNEINDFDRESDWLHLSSLVIILLEELFALREVHHHHPWIDPG